MISELCGDHVAAGQHLSLSLHRLGRADERVLVDVCALFGLSWRAILWPAADCVWAPSLKELNMTAITDLGILALIGSVAFLLAFHAAANSHPVILLPDLDL